MKKALVATAIGALVGSLLSACAPTSSVVIGSSLVIGQSAPATNLNSAVLDTVSADESNSALRDLTQSGFYDVAADGQLVANEKFGTAKIIDDSTDAFTIEYLLADGLKWSDSNPITAADLLVSWAAARNLGQAGFTSDLALTGLAKASKTPTVSKDGKKLTVVYDQPVADWQTAVTLTVPAHLLAKVGLGSYAGATNAEAQVVRAITKPDGVQLAKLATAFNSGFALSVNPLDKSLIFSSGAYNIESVSSSEALLTANTDCTWCRPAKVETIHLKFFSSTDTLLSAIKAGEIDLAQPRETGSINIAAIVDGVTSAKSRGMKYSSVSSGEVEAIVLNYGALSAFGPANLFGDEAQTKKLQQAFLKFVPRQRIADTLSVPVKLNRADSLAFATDSANYASSAQQNGSANFRIQDAEAAAELTAGIQKQFGVPIRVVFDSSNPREAIAFSSLSEFGSVSNLRLVNLSSENPDATAIQGNYEVQLKPVKLLSYSMAAVGQLESATTAFKSQKVSDLLTQIATNAKPSAQSQLLAQLDAALFADGYGLPLFELPRVVAFSSKLKNYSAPKAAQSITWGYTEWNVAADKS